MTSEGFFKELVAKNKQGIEVYPHETVKQGLPEKGLKITLTGKKEDYHIVNVEKFIDHIFNGDFDVVGRVKMKPLKGGQSNGFAVRTATMSISLIDEIDRRKNQNSNAVNERI